MLKFLQLLKIIAQCGIGGAGVAFLSEQTGMSLFVVRGMLDTLIDDGAIVRVKNKHYLTLCGNNMVLAYEAQCEGFEVSVVKTSEWSYQYQKSLV